LSYYTQFDVGSPTKLAQKTAFIGTGYQISIMTTYAGQHAYCTKSGYGFFIDRVYFRDSTNTKWFPFIKSVTEASTTPVTDNGTQAISASNRYYMFFTLPSTEKLYKITGIEWKNTNTETLSVQTGVDLVDANPPVAANAISVARGRNTTQSGTAVSIQRTSEMLHSEFIRGGTLLGAWIRESTGASGFDVRVLTGQAAQNFIINDGLVAAEPPKRMTTAWTTSTVRAYIKVYYVGYK